MLDAGGFPVTGERPAYEDAICTRTAMGSRETWLPYLGRAVKRLDPHVGFLPNVPFKAIWLDRNHKEQAKSQAKFAHWSMGLMIGRAGKRALEASYGKERDEVFRAFDRAGVDPIVLSFEELIYKPRKCAGIVAAVTGAVLDRDAMAEVVIRRGVACYPGMLEERLLAS
jgi:hypothetical protein